VHSPASHVGKHHRPCGQPGYRESDASGSVSIRKQTSPSMTRILPQIKCHFAEIYFVLRIPNKNVSQTHVASRFRVSGGMTLNAPRTRAFLFSDNLASRIV
jgi:hypothetical protein